MIKAGERLCNYQTSLHPDPPAQACSEMGTTLYPLNWSSSPSEQLLAGAGQLVFVRCFKAPEITLPGVQDRDALILPVTLRLRPGSEQDMRALQRPQKVWS